MKDLEMRLAFAKSLPVPTTAQELFTSFIPRLMEFNSDQLRYINAVFLFRLRREGEEPLEIVIDCRETSPGIRLPEADDKYNATIEAPEDLLLFYLSNGASMTESQLAASVIKHVNEKNIVLSKGALSLFTALKKNLGL